MKLTKIFSRGQPASEAWIEQSKQVFARLIDFGPDAPNDHKELVQLSFVEDLKIIFRLGQDSVSQLINHELLASWNIPKDQLFDAALSNLRKLYQDSADRMMIHNTFYGIDLPMEMASSLILDDTYWFDDLVPAERVIVSIPYRDALLFGDCETPGAYEGIASMAEEMWEACIPRHQLSKKLLVRDENSKTGWQFGNPRTVDPGRLN